MSKSNTKPAVKARSAPRRKAQPKPRDELARATRDLTAVVEQLGYLRWSLERAIDVFDMVIDELKPKVQQITSTDRPRQLRDEFRTRPDVADWERR